ncbi:MAG: hypothetical protein ACTS6P_01970 [Candidatus Hodgkinia cicadicola]
MSREQHHLNFKPSHSRTGSVISNYSNIINKTGGSTGGAKSYQNIKNLSNGGGWSKNFTTGCFGGQNPQPVDSRRSERLVVVYSASLYVFGGTTAAYDY